jgi:ubiquitin-protein ligase E3 C
LLSNVDPAHATSWPPLLFLADLYTQTLLTMGDDEFFGTTSNASQRNPLTLDELTSFSRQLLNIAFMLYWREDQTNVQEGGVSGAVRFTWEGVREKVTKCLLGIHARE